MITIVPLISTVTMGREDTYSRTGNVNRFKWLKIRITLILILRTEGNSWKSPENQRPDSQLNNCSILQYKIRILFAAMAEQCCTGFSHDLHEPSRGECKPALSLHEFHTLYYLCGLDRRNLPSSWQLHAKGPDLRALQTITSLLIVTAHFSQY